MVGVRTYAKKVYSTENSSVHLSKHKEENKKNPKLMKQAYSFDRRQSFHGNKLTEAKIIAFKESVDKLSQSS
jgi:hypothetical protein